MALPIRAPQSHLAKRDVKVHGVHYTPDELARFLAQRTLAHIRADGPVAILDPACGDGSLLTAVAAVASPEQHGTLRLVGIDRDPIAIKSAQERTSRLHNARLEFLVDDFLAASWPKPSMQPSLFDTVADFQPSVNRLYDAVISNPPYVRTQVLGSNRSRQLAEQYGLSGRVDLYHAFVSAMTQCLCDGGILGLLCSNRFLTTQGGAALREVLSKEYELCELFDLGDTKLFTAAVLPAIVIARKCARPHKQICGFARVYESRDISQKSTASTCSSVLTALDSSVAGAVQVGGTTYLIEHGMLDLHEGAAVPWVMTSPSVSSWLRTVEEHTACTIEDVASIRVGIKTTADSVFIRMDWDQLPEKLRPEEDLLYPLITHHSVRRWAPEPEATSKRVLYPHLMTSGRRAAVDLSHYPCASRYLKSYYDRLASRTYVTKAKRLWYEIWVPQNPDEWSGPKIVFPDISETPRFCLDTSGAIVNGDCYWIPVGGTLDQDLAFLMLVVANSSFAATFYDTVCGNRLYSGRRRFMTQYVKRFPLPQLTEADMRRVRGYVSELISDSAPRDTRRSGIEEKLDRLVWKSFGLSKESSR